MSANNILSARNKAEVKSKYKKMSIEDFRYIELLARDYNMSLNAAFQARKLNDMSFKELYKKFDAEEKLVLELQSYFAESEPKDLTWLFKGQTREDQRGYEFLKILYAQNTMRRINAVFVKKCELIKSKLNEC